VPRGEQNFSLAASSRKFSLEVHVKHRQQGTESFSVTAFGSEVVIDSSKLNIRGYFVVASGGHKWLNLFD
jgi:hypothetical protein